MPELKPCPFCGCKAKTVMTRDGKWHGVKCSNHNCIANSISPEYDLRTQGIEAWNRRVPQTVVNQHGENCTHISNCGTLNLNL